jgi:hypothetical protein
MKDLMTLPRGDGRLLGTELAQARSPRPGLPGPLSRTVA